MAWRTSLQAGAVLNNSDTQTTADFFCDTGAGQCFTKCDYDSADDTQSSDCPLNSYCLSELTAVEPGEFNGACLPGDCDSNIFDPAACDEVGTCRPIGNGASEDAQEEERRHPRGRRHTDHERGVGELQHEPAQRHELHAHADRLHDRGCPQQAIVSVPKRGSPDGVCGQV